MFWSFSIWTVKHCPWFSFLSAWFFVTWLNVMNSAVIHCSCGPLCLLIVYSRWPIWFILLSFLFPLQMTDRFLYLFTSRVTSWRGWVISFCSIFCFFFLTPAFSLYQCLSVSACLFLLCTGPCREVPVGAGVGAVWGSPGSNPAAGCMYLICKETAKFIIISSTVKVLMNYLFVWIIQHISG